MDVLDTLVEMELKSAFEIREAGEDSSGLGQITIITLYYMVVGREIAVENT